MAVQGLHRDQHDEVAHRGSNLGLWCRKMSAQSKKNALAAYGTVLRFKSCENRILSTVLGFLLFLHLAAPFSSRLRELEPRELRRRRSIGYVNDQVDDDHQEKEEGGRSTRDHDRVELHPRAFDDRQQIIGAAPVVLTRVRQCGEGASCGRAWQAGGMFVENDGAGLARVRWRRAQPGR